MSRKPHDRVAHPRQYMSHPSKIECIEVMERMPSVPGSAVRHLWRADTMGEPGMDIAKAAFYLDRLLAPDYNGLVAPKGDVILANYGRRILSHKHWNSSPIWHIINGVVEANNYEFAAARNILHHFQMHPQERVRAH